MLGSPRKYGLIRDGLGLLYMKADPNRVYFNESLIKMYILASEPDFLILILYSDPKKLVIYSFIGGGGRDERVLDFYNYNIKMAISSPHGQWSLLF